MCTSQKFALVFPRIANLISGFGPTQSKARFWLGYQQKCSALTANGWNAGVKLCLTLADVRGLGCRDYPRAQSKSQVKNCGNSRKTD